MNLLRHGAFCDTSFFFASLCPSDTNFHRAGELLEYCSRNSVTLFATWDIVSETVTLLRYRADYRLSVAFLDEIVPSLHLVRYDESVRLSAAEVFRKIAKDKRLSFCDAISFVVVTGMLDNLPCLTFDRDFRSLGLTVLP